DGVTRRNFLQIGAFGTVSLASLLRAHAANPNPGAAVPGLSRTTPKAAIMIYLPGGPSHIDMYDPKPDAPKEFRGEFNPIATNVSGIRICEHMPLQAAMMDKLTIIRSIVSVDEHSDSLVMTGYSENQNRNVGHPSFGSVVSKVRHSQGNDVPPF